jgi:hypothetical protein
MISVLNAGRGDARRGGRHMQIYYLLPVVLIAAAVGYSLFVSKKAIAQAANMSPEEAKQKFQDFYGQYFELGAGQELVGVWSGVEYHSPKSVGQKIGAAAGELALNYVGVSKYIPNVHIGLTQGGEVLVSREYSDMGSRGNFKQILTLGAGTRALGAAASHPGEDLGKAPNNPFNPIVGLEFVELKPPSGEGYAAWLSPQGVLVGQPGFHSVLQRLS